MNHLRTKLESASFPTLAKRLILLTLAIALLGGALSVWMLRTQISELAALDDSLHEGVAAVEGTPWQEDSGDGHRELDLFDAGLITRPTAGAVATIAVTGLLCVLCALAWWLLIAAWLYQASARAGMNRALWTVLGLVGGPAAVAVFLIARGRRSRCPACGTWQAPAAYCRRCGAPMQKRCPVCGRVCKSDDTYCPDCGTALAKAAEQHAGPAGGAADHESRQTAAEENGN